MISESQCGRPAAVLRADNNLLQARLSQRQEYQQERHRISLSFPPLLRTLKGKERIRCVEETDSKYRVCYIALGEWGVG